MEGHFDRRYPILRSPSIAPDVSRAVRDGSVIWLSPSCLQVQRNPGEPLPQRLRGAGTLPQQRSPLSVSVVLKRRASRPQGFPDRSFDSGPVETRFQGRKRFPRNKQSRRNPIFPQGLSPSAIISMTPSNRVGCLALVLVKPLPPNL